MADAAKWKVSFVSSKLNFLKEYKILLDTALDDYVGKIVATGNGWAEGGESNMDFAELCQALDRAIEFICVKYEEICGFAVNVTVDPQQLPSVQESRSMKETVKEQPLTAGQMTVPPTENRQTTLPGQAADHATISQVLARIVVMEEAMSSFHSKTDRVVEQQTVLDKQISDISVKISMSDKQLNEMSSELSRSSKRFNVMSSEMMKSEKQQNSKFMEIKEQIKQLSENLADDKKEEELRFRGVEKQLKKMNSQQGRFDEKLEPYAELGKKFINIMEETDAVKAHIEELTCKLETLSSRTEEITDEHSIKNGSLETMTIDLSNKMVSNSGTIESMFETLKREMTSWKEFETRLLALETDGNNTLKDLKSEMQDCGTKFEILCEMINKRLRPMEQLRRSLGDRVSAGSNNVKMLNDVVQEVAALTPRLKVLEIQSQKSEVGFSARTWIITSDAKEDIPVTAYKETFCNAGNHFDPLTGEFTAPKDGLYVVCLSVCEDTRNTSTSCIGIKQTPVDSVKKSDNFNCACLMKSDKRFDHQVCLKEMKAGDVLNGFIYVLCKSVRLSMSFSCYKLG